MNGNQPTTEPVAAPPNVPLPAEIATQSGATTQPPAVNLRILLMAIVLVSAFAELSYAVVNLSAMPVFITKTANLDVRWVGIIGTAYLIAEGILKSPFGLLGDRIGRKVLIVSGPILSTFTALLTPHIHNPYALLGLRVIDGIGAAALWPSAFSLIGDHVPEAKRASAMSLFNLAYILGIALGPALGGFVNEGAERMLVSSGMIVGVAEIRSKAYSFYAAAILFALTAVIALFAIPGGKPTHHDVEHAGQTAEGGFNFGDFKKMLGQIPATLLMAFVTFLGIGLIMLYVKVFAGDLLDMSESEFGKLLIVPALVIAAVSVPLGTLGDKIGKARTVRIGIGLCALSLWLLIAYPVKWNLMLMGALNGIGFVMAFPAWMALVSSRCDPKQRGAVVGAVGTAQGIGAIIGAAASGFLYKINEIYLGPLTIPPHYLPFIGCSILLTVSFLLAVFTVHDNRATI